MPKRVLFFTSLCLMIFSLHAEKPNMTSMMQNNKKTYEIDAGHFDNKNSALQLKFKLAYALKQPISIEKDQQNHEYAVKIGPIDNIDTAKKIRKELHHQLSPRSQKSIQGNKLSSILAMAQNDAKDPLTIPNVADNPQSADDPKVANNPQVADDPPNNDTAQPLTRNQRLWNLQSADIRAVIGEVSRVTGKNFIIDPRVQGKISIISGTPISANALYKVFLSMLQVSGYSAIPNGNIIKIVPNMEAKAMAANKSLTNRQLSSGDEMLVEVVPVHYVPADQLVPVLRPLMPQWSSVSAYAPSNVLILSGHASNIRTVAEIIKQVDTSNANGIDIIPLHNALAMDVVNTMKDLVKPQASFGMRTPPSLAADDRSNAILLSGNRTDRIRLRLLISQLDRHTPEAGNSNTQVVYLNYLRAEDLVPILAGIAQANFSGTVGTTIGTITRPILDSTNPASSLAGNSQPSSSDNNSNQAASSAQANAAAPNTANAATQNEGSTKPTVQIIGEPNTNSIILNAPVSIIRVLKSVIAQLDIKPAQLLIEALVAEVDENSARNLGIEWGSKQQTTLPGNFRPGFAIINSNTSINDFQAQIYALVRERKANVLSTPSVVVLDNRQAKILVGRQVSVTSTTYPNNAGGTALGSPYETFNRVNVALHLYVRPQITRGSGIQLQIDQGNDTIDPSTAATTNPIFNVSSIVTSIQVNSGDVVVLGGLVQDSLANSNVDVPIVRGLPGIGRFFQNNIRTREKRVLMVFIRTKILNIEQDALDVSGEKYRSVREHQLGRLREQDFQQDNEEVILPALKKAQLPLPFSQVALGTVTK